MIVTKTNFIGGMNQLADITKLDPSQYWLLLNARNRKNAIETINLPSDETGNLTSISNFQDISAAGSLLLAFGDGQAFYRTTTGSWQKIETFQMGSTEDRVYTEVIPGSTVNYTRTSTGPSGTFALASAITASEAAMIVMDGVKQSWVILPNGTARVTGTYASWTINTPEYVPIATKPMFYNGVLYAIAKDAAGRFTQIVRSCTGQPLNYVIAVDETGGKTSTNETEGGALAMAHNIGYEELNALSRANSIEGAFVASSTHKTCLVYPDTANLIYAEPQFRNQEIASIGALNQDSIVDVLGDVAIVHDTGIRSFNGIMQFRYEGRNAPFSAPINSLLDGITQTAAATGTHDNYAMFAVETVYGNGILWYDMLIQAFVSLDIYPNVGRILKFTSVIDNGTRYTYFMTATKIYKLFGSAERATATLYGNELIASQDYNAVQLTTARLQFNGVIEGGFAEALLFVDGQLSNWKSSTIVPVATNATTQRSIPYDTPLTEGAIVPVEFNMQDNSPTGTRIGVLIRFNTDGRLISAAANVSESMKWPLVASTSTVTPNNPEFFVIIGDDGVGPSGFTPEEYANRVALNTRVRSLKNVTKFIGTGDHAYNSGTLTEVTNNLAPYWGNVKSSCAFVPGNHDNDTAQGQAFFEYFAQPRYSRVSTDNVDIFLINTGIDSAGNQTEIDNQDAAELKDCRQFRWLKSALATSTKKHRWVIWHHPPVTSGEDYYPGNTTMQTIPLKEWGATALMCGHAHIVERLDWDGLLVIISGAGGRDFRGIHNPPSPYSSFAMGEISAYWEATVTPLGANFICKSSSGVILDRYFQAI
jgi:hypothetical protein